MRPPAVLAIHGGAGPAPDDDPAARWPRQASGLAAALRAGLAVLAEGGPALVAAVATVAVLEDDEQWNAGRGSALTAAGTVEMDAAVADGATGRAGGVAVVTGVRHAVLAARAVMDDGRHVLLAGTGAEALAREAGLAFEPEGWFVTDRRRRDLARRLGAGAGGLGGPAGGPRPSGGSTVGAVARDASGHLAAATSTGGRTGQLPGRIGDSPVPGAGTWADDATCAVSATGIGEAFLRAAFAHEVDARLRLEGADLDAACRAALAAVGAAGGDGGCIAVTAAGPPVLAFTTALMHRGWAEVGGPLHLGAGPGPLDRVE
jgi:isoaspartyl peptidase/L-asparaginase-like protein (Ntn-hydrolase superfamily)